MSATKKSKKSKVEAKRERKERRFSPEATYASRLPTALGMLGALGLGAGVYANWIREEPLAFAPYLVAAGALLLAFALWKGGAQVGKIRVGDAGVALDEEGDLVRILWCDMERVEMAGGELIIRSEQATIRFPVAAHPKAATWVVHEGGRRMPDMMAVNRAEIQQLGEPAELDGEPVLIEEVQVTGRHCRATGKPIAFERDARLCPTCGQVYLKDSVPKKCLTCSNELATRAREP